MRVERRVFGSSEPATGPITIGIGTHPSFTDAVIRRVVHVAMHPKARFPPLYKAFEIRSVRNIQRVPEKSWRHRSRGGRMMRHDDRGAVECLSQFRLDVQPLAYVVRCPSFGSNLNFPGVPGRIARLLMNR